MKGIELSIITLSPLAVSRQKPGGSVSEVEKFIPGSVIRGTIATQILRDSGLHNENLAGSENDFNSLFLGENPAIFHNAYPAIAKIDKDKSAEVAGRVKVLPGTAVSSKTTSGFKSEDESLDNSKKRGGVFDTLIDRFCAEAYNFPYDPSCPKDSGRVEPFGGFYSQEKGKYRSHNVSTRFLTRVGINRRRATSADDILYSIEVLNESFVLNSKLEIKEWDNVVYRSLVLVEQEQLAEHVKSFLNNNTIRLGASTSRGLGKVKIVAKDAERSEDIKLRVQKFNDKLKERWQKFSVFGEARENLLDRTYFTLDLQSDAILNENWQRTTVISPEMLCQFAELEEDFSKCDDKDDLIKLHVAYSSYDYRSGWNSAWGLMKDIELVTNRGGVYLFSTKKPDIWLEKLAKLEEMGVGDRTCEGFGQIEVCNDFHLITRDNPA